jgi:cold shock CspA family protein
MTPKYPVARQHLGWIREVNPDRGFGFIEGEDFRQDVFFRFETWEGPQPPRDPRGLVVEFEIDELFLKENKRLRASVVRRTHRPMGRAIDPTGDPRLKAKHHPRALRRKPSWRAKAAPPATGEAASGS